MIVTILGLGCEVYSKGFENLTDSLDNFSSVNADKEFIFPEDHGSHKTFRTEWWYLTANLEDRFGNSFGIQWTLFRSALKAGDKRNGWESSQVWMGHSAITSAEYHLFSEKFARGGIGQAGVKSAPFEAWIDDWAFSGDWTSANVDASGDQFAYKLKLFTNKPLIFHGKNGLSQKSEAGASSYYYSQPFFEVAGSLRIKGATHKVKGKAWADREWSSQLLDKDQTGWNWLGLHLDDGSKIMLFEVRNKVGKSFFSGTRIYENGTSKNLNSESFSLLPTPSSKLHENKPQLNWQVKIPEENLLIYIEPLNENSYMETIIPYWEGPVSFNGTHKGVGFLEITLPR